MYGYDFQFFLFVRMCNVPSYLKDNNKNKVCSRKNKEWERERGTENKSREENNDDYYKFASFHSVNRRFGLLFSSCHFVVSGRFSLSLCSIVDRIRLDHTKYSMEKCMWCLCRLHLQCFCCCSVTNCVVVAVTIATESKDREEEEDEEAKRDRGEQRKRDWNSDNELHCCMSAFY